jgi:hypothetical protein
LFFGLKEDQDETEEASRQQASENCLPPRFRADDSVIIEIHDQVLFFPENLLDRLRQIPSNPGVNTDRRQIGEKTAWIPSG